MSTPLPPPAAWTPRPQNSQALTKTRASQPTPSTHLSSTCRRPFPRDLHPPRGSVSLRSEGSGELTSPPLTAHQSLFMCHPVYQALDLMQTCDVISFSRRLLIPQRKALSLRGAQ